MNTYYVNKGTCIGKVYTARNDAEAIAYGKGYATAKNWKQFKITRTGVVENDGSAETRERKSA